MGDSGVYRARLKPMESVLAIDIGGTKVDVGLVTFEGQIISRDRILTLEGTEESLYKRI